jgi:hypothetical protein
VVVLTSDSIRRSMINCSKGDAKRMTITDHALDADLEAVEYVGWHDPKTPQRAYLVTRHHDAVTGIALRVAAGGARRAAMCALCRTTHTNGDVSLYGARRAGTAGREGSSVGTYICDDLACAVTARLEKQRDATVVPDLGLPVEERVAGLRTRLDAFLDSVRRDG